MPTIVIRLWNLTIKDTKVTHQTCELITHISTEFMCDTSFTHIWDFKLNCNGRQGTEVAKHLLAGLDKLAYYNIEPASKDTSTHEELKNTYRGRLSVFAYHLQRLSKLAQDYSEYFFIDQADYYSPIILENGTEITRMPSLIPSLNAIHPEPPIEDSVPHISEKSTSVQGVMKGIFIYVTIITIPIVLSFFLWRCKDTEIIESTHYNN